MRRVVVTGMGALTPIGKNVDEFWNNLVKGVSGAEPITRFNAENFKTKFACHLKDYDPLDYFDRKEARKMDPYAQYGLIAAEEAYQQAGLADADINRERAGIIWASGIGGIETFTDEIKGFLENNEVPRFNPFFIPKMISDIAAGMMSMKYGFLGHNNGTVSACESSTNALIDA